jgi:hypothetical protein
MDVLEDHVGPIFRVEEYAKHETSAKQVAIRPGFLLGLFLDLENGGDTFLRNVG